MNLWYLPQLMKIFFVLALLAPSLALGQKVAHKHLRLLPLGRMAGWSDVLKDGVRVQVPPPPEMVMPEELTMPDGTKDGIQSTPLFLLTMTKPLRLDPKIASFQFHEGKLVTGAPLLKVPAPKSAMTLGVLYPAHGPQKWKKPNVLLVDDGEETFQPGTMRFVNVSDRTALVKVGRKTVSIKPDGFKILPLKVGSNKVMVGYQKKGSTEQVVIHESLAVRILSNQRVQSFFYNKTDKKAGEDPGFHWLPEPAPSL